MWYTKFTTWRYIISIGAIIVAVSDWGSPAAFVIVGVLLLAHGIDLARYCKKHIDNQKK